MARPEGAGPQPDPAISPEKQTPPSPAREPAAPAPPAPDEEKLRLAEELRQARAALGEVGEMVKSGRLKVVEEGAKAADPMLEDDSALVDRKELKRFADDIKRTVAGVVVETTAQSARQIRASQTEHLRSKLKNFDKYQPEIDALLDKVDPRLAADPATIQQVYRIVRANHYDEEVEEEVRARASTAEPSEEDEAWGETPEEVDMEPEGAKPAGRAPQASPVARPRGGVAPSGDASASRPSLRAAQRVEPLSRQERQIAEVFGIKSADEWRKYADPTWKPDLMGFKGRQRI